MQQTNLSQFNRIKAMVEKEVPLWNESNKLDIVSTVLLKYLTIIDGMSDHDLTLIVKNEQKHLSKSTGNNFGIDSQIDENKLSGEEDKKINDFDVEDNSELNEDEAGDDIRTENSPHEDNKIEILFNVIDESHLSFIEKESLRSFYDKGYDSFVLKNFTSIGKSRIFSEAYRKIGTAV